MIRESRQREFVENRARKRAGYVVRLVDSFHRRLLVVALRPRSYDNAAWIARWIWI